MIVRHERSIRRRKRRSTHNVIIAVAVAVASAVAAATPREKRGGSGIERGSNDGTSLVAAADGHG